MSDTQTVETKPIAQTDSEVVQAATEIVRTGARQPELARGGPMDRFIDVALEKGDVGMLRELLATRREEHKDMERQAYAQAIVQFQALCPTVIRTGNNTRFGNQYAQWESAHVQIKPALNQAQLAVTHRVSTDEKGIITVVAQCRHGLGHIEETQLSAPPDRLSSKEGKAVRNDLQAIKSTITFLKCTTAFSLLGIDSRDRLKNEPINPIAEAAIDKDDDDGNGAGEPIPPPQPPAPLTNPDPKEDEAKRRFRDIVLCKVGVKSVSRDLLKSIYEQAKTASGKASVAECADWLASEDVLVSQGGVLSIVTDPFGDDQTPAAADPTDLQGGADPASTSPQPPSSSESNPWQCTQCGESYVVKTAGGRCLMPKCGGKVERRTS